MNFQIRYKNRIIILIFSCLALIFSIIISIMSDNVQNPVFSVDSGFYDEPFELTLTAGYGNKIYYTLDGSNPIDNGTLYTNSINIYDISEEENIISSRKDISIEIVECQDESEYGFLDKKVDKAVNIRAVAVSRDGKEYSEIVTKNYFVGFSDKGYSELPIICLSVDIDDLFDYKKGIYTTGKIYEDNIKNGTHDSYSANYTQRGEEWERKVNIQYFEDNKCLWNQNAGIRIKGLGSRVFPQKSFNLIQRSKYDGNKEFLYLPLSPYGKEKISLSSGGNDIYHKLKDYIVGNLCEGLNYSVLKSRPCYLFLNGEFWGVYYIQECYNEAYISEHYGIKKESVEIIKDNPDYLVEYKDLSIEENYKELCEKIDISSYIDYYATMIIIARTGDWPGYNEAYWRTVEKNNTKYGDGKYRWMLYDVNSPCMTVNLIDFDSFSYLVEKDKLFSNLSKNKEFRYELSREIEEQLNTVFEQESIESFLEETYQVMKVPMKHSFSRWTWNNHGDETYWEEGITSYINFFKNRRERVIEYLKKWEESYSNK